jgi:hypothetical protein
MEDLSVTLGRMKAFIGGLPEFKDRLAVMLSGDAKQMVQNRIVERGVDADGAPLKNAKTGTEYSDREVPTSFFVDSGTISPAQAKRLPIVTTYVDVKKMLGRYRGKRDMNLTGRMWKGTGLVSKQVTPGGFVATVAGQNKETQDKLNRNSETAGVDALELAEAEVGELALTLDGELQAELDRCGL